MNDELTAIDKARDANLCTSADVHMLIAAGYRFDMMTTAEEYFDQVSTNSARDIFNYEPHVVSKFAIECDMYPLRAVYDLGISKPIVNDTTYIALDLHDGLIYVSMDTILVWK